MADAEPSEEVPQLTFSVKTNEAKYSVTLPSSATVADLKQKLSTSDFADIPADRQRLIFSGRVLKDTDTLASANIKEGHTIHLVRGAASNARQTPAAQPASTASTSSPASNIPTNIAAGTGNNPLAQLTGARYAGFHGLPNAATFGADGGMGPPANAEEMLRQLDNPNFVQQMNEVMNSPMFLEMLENTPMFRDNPLARQMMRDPNIRRMMLDPNVIRAQLQMQQQMGGGGLGGSSFPAPGVTDTTQQTSGTTGTETRDQTQTPNQNAGNPPPFMFPGMGGGNPFAALFQPPPAATGTAQTPSDTTNNTITTSGATDNATAPTAGANPQQNPFGNLFGPGFAEYLAAAGAAGAAGGQQAGTGNAGNAGNLNSAFNNPALLASLLEGMGAPTQSPPDNRPPEERYAEQLGQLNDMGFFEFDRNIEALRRSGGSVQGAVEYLLTHPGGS